MFKCPGRPTGTQHALYQDTETKAHSFKYLHWHVKIALIKSYVRTKPLIKLKREKIILCKMK